MVIEKSLYELPQGLGTLDTEPIEIEIEDSVEVEIEPEEEPEEPEEEPEDFDANLAELMSENELSALASELVEFIDDDIAARKDWADMYVKGLDVLGTKYEDMTEPWDGACGVFSTILNEAAIRFQSEGIMETFPASGPVKTQIIGQVTKENQDAADRVRQDMNYRLTEQMPEYRSEHERMLYSLALAGSAFKKVYFDPGLDRQVSIFVPAEDIVLPFGTTNTFMSERLTHLMRKTKNEVERLQTEGFYRDIDLGEPLNMPTDIEKKKAEQEGIRISDDDRYSLAEVAILLKLPGFEKDSPDGLAVPYIITIDRGSNKVLAIRRNWNPDDEKQRPRQHFIHYIYVPGFGAYGFGLIHIVGGYAMTGTLLIRQLVDAGTLSNLPGGLKTRGLRVKGDDTPIAPGEFRDVDVPSGSIKDNIMMLPYKEPSSTLAALLDKITEEGRRMASIADLKVSDMSAQAPVGTTLAILERQLKVMGAVQARVHSAMREEFKLLKQIIRDYTSPDYSYVPEDGSPQVKQSDYDMVEVIPVSDPNASTMAQKVAQYQAVFQLAQGAPQIYDMPRLHRQMLEVLGVKNADKLVPIEDDAKPQDPVTENMNIIKNKPVKAFIYQDHQAHIATHMSFKNDPILQQTLGQNPAYQQQMSALMAHVAEHVGFQYRVDMEQKVGAGLPAPDKDISEQDELIVSRYVAQAAPMLQQMHQAQAAQQQAQQQAQDPLIQMQQQELQIKAMEQQRKAQKDMMDSQLAAQRLRVEEQRVQVDAKKEGMRLVNQNQQNDKKIQADILKSMMKDNKRGQQNTGAPPQRAQQKD